MAMIREMAKIRDGEIYFHVHECGTSIGGRDEHDPPHCHIATTPNADQADLPPYKICKMRLVSKFPGSIDSLILGEFSEIPNVPKKKVEKSLKKKIKGVSIYNMILILYDSMNSGSRLFLSDN